MEVYPSEAEENAPHVEYSFLDPKFSSAWNPRRALAYTSVVLPLGDPSTPRNANANANGRGGNGGTGGRQNGNGEAAARSMLPPPPPPPVPSPSNGEQNEDEELLEVEQPPLIDRSLLRAPIRVQDPIGGTKDTVYGSTFRNFAMNRSNPYAKFVWHKPKVNEQLADPKCDFKSAQRWLDFIIEIFWWNR